MFTIEQANNNYPNGGGDGSGGDYPTNATFDTIKVNKVATFTVNNKDITFANHETRIKTLEESSNNNNNNGIVTGNNLFSSSVGYPEIIITDNVSQTIDGNKKTLTITIDENSYKDYAGDMIEFVLPGSFHITESVRITRQTDKTYTCPVIALKDNNYSLTNIPKQNSLYIQIDSLFDNPMSLFTSGDLQIRSVVKQPALSTNNVIKCGKIEADNTFNLYRSPLPNLYDMREYGETNAHWWGYFGYNSDSEEFSKLLDGQEFRFTDNAFGCSYTLTKQQDKWIGHNLCYHVPEQITKNDRESSYAKLFMKWDIVNSRIFELCTGFYISVSMDINPLKWLYDNNKMEFDFYKTPKYHKDGKDGDYWWIQFKDNDAGYDYSKTITITLNLNNEDTSCSRKIVCQWNFHSVNLVNIFKAELNQIERIGLDYSSNRVYSWIPNGLYLFMEKEMVFALDDDIGYETGTNPFEFLANKCCYTITPRPEACSTLETSYNIRTSGVVIGQNIESHVFTLNSMGNTVDRTVNRVEDIQRVCQDLQSQINGMKNKTDWFTIIKNVISITSGIIGVVNGIRTFSTFAANGIGGIAANCLAVGKQAEEVVEEEVIDEIIRDVDVLSPGITTRELELIDEPKETTIDGVDTIISFYHLSYVNKDYKLGLITIDNGTGDELEELVDYDYDNKKFTPKDETIQIVYKPEEQLLIIIGKHYDKVKIEFIKKSYGLGANNLGTTLSNKKLLTAAAVKKLIDNNLRHNNTLQSNSLSGLADFRKYDDLTYVTKSTELTVTDNEYVNETYNFNHTTSHIPYHNNAKLKGKMINVNTSLSFKFTLDFEEESQEDNISIMKQGDIVFHWDTVTGALFIIIKEDLFYVELESATLANITDEFILRSEFEALKARIEALENKNNNDELNKELDKQITELEVKCRNIIPTIEKTGDLTLEDRIELLESQCKNILINDKRSLTELCSETTADLTLKERLTLIDKKLANII